MIPDPSYSDVVDPRMIGHGLTPSEAVLLDCLFVGSHEPTYAKLYVLGIYGPTVTGGDLFNALHCDSVCFLPGDRFEFARNLRDPTGYVFAVIIPALDEWGQTIDLVAWGMDNGAVATWRGEAVMLGEEQINSPRLDGDALWVFADAADWLRAGRRGVVVLDASRVRWRLAEEKLIVADAAFGRRLRDALRLPEPRIFVAKAGKVAA